VVFDGARAHKQLVARVISARPGRATAARRGPSLRVAASISSATAQMLNYCTGESSLACCAAASASS
jgi:hypothetical protein